MIGWVRENWLYGVLGIVASMIVAPGAVAQVPVLGGLVAADAAECIPAEDTGDTADAGCDDTAETAPGSLAMRDEDGAGGDDADPKPRRARDRDGDGVRDRRDNCPDVANPGQRDSDEDGTGDRCAPAPDQRDAPAPEPPVAEPTPEPTPVTEPTPEPTPEVEPDPQDPDADDDPAAEEQAPIADRDRDRVADDVDNCPDVKNWGQYDHDLDGVGDKCDIPDECANVGEDPTFVYPRPERPGRTLTMVGTPGNDVFFGRWGGVNVMYGMGGNDCFIGRSSINIMFGGTGDDVMRVSPRRSVLFSGGGDDTVIRTTFDGTVIPDDGADTVPSEDGADTGMPEGADTVPSEDGADTGMPEDQISPWRRVRCFGFPAATPGCWRVDAAPEPGSIFDVEGLRVRRDGQIAERLWRLVHPNRPDLEWPGFDGGPVVIRGVGARL